jgi:hypothetical protein
MHRRGIKKGLVTNSTIRFTREYTYTKQKDKKTEGYCTRCGWHLCFDPDVKGKKSLKKNKQVREKKKFAYLEEYS